MTKELAEKCAQDFWDWIWMYDGITDERGKLRFGPGEPDDEFWRSYKEKMGDVFTEPWYSLIRVTRWNTNPHVVPTGIRQNLIAALETLGLP